MEGKIKKVLFVCTGNICRSPFAEGFFTRLVVTEGLNGISADSAGIFALPGNSATHMSQRVAAEYHVELGGHKAKSVSKDLIAGSDLILVMEKSQENSLMSLFPEASGKTLLIRHFARFGSRRRGIADPYGLAYEAYRFCFLDIEDAVIGIVEFLSRK